MPNDAKLGLVLGIGLVIAIGVVFFRKEPSPGAASATGAPAAVTPVRAPGERGQFRPARAKVMSADSADSASAPAGADERTTATSPQLP